MCLVTLVTLRHFKIPIPHSLPMGRGKGTGKGTFSLQVSAFLGISPNIFKQALPPNTHYVRTLTIRFQHEQPYDCSVKTLFCLFIKTA